MWKSPFKNCKRIENLSEDRKIPWHFLHQTYFSGSGLHFSIITLIDQKWNLWTIEFEVAFQSSNWQFLLQLPRCTVHTIWPHNLDLFSGWNWICWNPGFVQEWQPCQNPRLVFLFLFTSVSVLTNSLVSNSLESLSDIRSATARLVLICSDLWVLDQVSFG